MSWFSDKSRKFDDEKKIDSEISFHVEEMTRANIVGGMTPVEARRRAVLDFGGAEQVKQQVREVYISAMMDGLRLNLRSAMCFIRKDPSFAVVVVLTLGLGIGANSAVFSAIDAILLRPLSYSHSGELVELHQQNLKQGRLPTPVSTVRLEDWSRDNSTFQSISGFYAQNVTLNTGELPERITEAYVTPRFLQVWGVTPVLGRDFTREEEKFGGPNAALVSNRFWRMHLHSDPAAVGKIVRLDGFSTTVVGVLPASFLFPDREVDVWSPSQVDAPYAQDRSSTWFSVQGRLKPGVTRAQAQADMATVQARLGKQFPKSDGNLTVLLVPLKSVVIGSIGSSLWILYGSVSLLLLIACMNIAVLLLARTAEREHEISIRYALGASRREIIFQLLTEVLVLAVAGSVAGLAVAAGASRAFAHFSKNLPRVDEIALNWRIVMYSLVCAVVATLVCGLFPAIRGSRGSLSGSLSQSSPRQVSARNPWQSILMGVQVSLAVTLLIGAGLLLRSFQAIGRVNPGFDPNHVLTLRISGSWGETTKPEKMSQRINRTLDGLRSVPGVEAIAISGTIPGNSSGYPVELKISEGQRDPNRKVIANAHIVSAGYFDVLRIPLLAGEVCNDRSATNTVMVNQSFADTYMANFSVIGYHLAYAAASSMKPPEIRGIVGDAREESLDQLPGPAVYWCRTEAMPDPNYLIRTHGDPMAMAATLRTKIHQLEPARSVFSVMPLESHLGDQLAENRLRTILLTLFAMTAISLVCIGLYGTISYLGRTRRREVGLRLALGAVPRQITRRFLLQGLRVALIGCVAGLVLAAGLSRLLAGMLYGVSALDPATYVIVLLLTLLVATIASLVPAVRAARVEPTEVLREA
ncbi:MAG: ABC transporter permease [Edaphobacter sp.]